MAAMAAGGAKGNLGGAGSRAGGSARRYRRPLVVLGVVLLVAVAVLVPAATAVGAQPYEKYEETIAEAHPVAQFRFSDLAGSFEVADSAGDYSAANDGIALGGEGPFGGSKSGYFGGEAYAALPSDPLEGAGEFTVEAWVYWDGGTSYKQPIFDFGSSSTNYMYMTPASSLSSHVMLFEIHTSTGSDVQLTTTKLGANAWKYVAVTETGSGELTFYVNGEKAGQITGASLFPSSLGSSLNEDYLGKSLVSGEFSFKGSLSNVAFYSKALSASEIENHYDEGEFPVDIEPPTITGTAKEGRTLTAHAGSWSGLTPITFGYQWERCEGSSCTEIAGAVESKYDPVSKDVGKELRVAVKASNEAGSSMGSTASEDVGPIEGNKPTNTEAPVISGTTEVGRLLEVSSGKWSGTEPFSYKYAWEACSEGRNCEAIQGATAPSPDLAVSLPE